MKAKKVIFIMAIVLIVMSACMSVYAVSSMDDMLGRVKTLGTDITTWVATAAGVICAAMLAFHGLVYLSTDDDGIKVQKKRMMKGSFIGLVITLFAGFIVSTFISYFV